MATSLQLSEKHDKMHDIINKAFVVVLKNWSEGFLRARKQASHFVYLFCRPEKFLKLLMLK